MKEKCAGGDGRCVNARQPGKARAERTKTKAVSQCEESSQTNHSSAAAGRQIEMRDRSQGQRALDRDVIRIAQVYPLDERWMQRRYRVDERGKSDMGKCKKEDPTGSVEEIFG